MVKYSGYLRISGAYVAIIAVLLWTSVVLLNGCSPACAVEQGTPESAVTIAPSPVPTPVTLRVYTGGEGSTIDPAYVPEADPGDYMGHLFEGLMKYVPANQDTAVSDLVLVTGLAESVDICEDGLVYRFTLRADALWSDGQPVSAEEFVYAWQRVLDAGCSPGAELIREKVETFYGEADNVLVVQLKQRCPWFLELCAAYYMVPLRRDVVERYGGDWTNEENIVVSGPYTIERWVHDDAMVLVPNPYYYHRDAVGPQELVWQFSGGTGAHVTARQEVCDSYVLCFNTGTIRDWRVRAAMLLAVDREALGAAATGLVPDGEGAVMYEWLAERYSRYDLTNLEGRRELAGDLMAMARAAGTWHSGYTVYYRVTEDPRHGEIARQCIEDWQQVLGLHGEIVETPAEDYPQVLTSMRYDIAFMEYQPEYDDPMAYLQTLKRGGADNHTGWGDVRYDELLARAAEATDGGVRNGLLREAEAFLFREDGFAVCPLLWPKAEYEVNGVTGAGYGAGQWRFQYAVIE